MNWAEKYVCRELGLDPNTIRQIEIGALRLLEAQKPDGKYSYIPCTCAYRVMFILSKETLKRVTAKEIIDICK